MKPLNTTDVHTDTDEVPHAQLAKLAAMARSIFHQVGATEVAQPELLTLNSGPAVNAAVFDINPSFGNGGGSPGTWGEVFTAPQSDLQSATFYVEFGTNTGPNPATYFEIELYKWSTALGTTVGNPIFVSSPVLQFSLLLQTTIHQIRSMECTRRHLT